MSQRKITPRGGGVFEEHNMPNEVRAALHRRFRQGADGAEEMAHLLCVGKVEALVLNPSNGDIGECVTSLKIEEGGGIPGDRLYGRSVVVKPTDLTPYPVQPVGRTMVNQAQVKIISRQESNEIRLAMGLGDGALPARLQQENLYLSVPDLSGLPTGSQLMFASTGGMLREGVLQVSGRARPFPITDAAIKKHLAQENRQPTALYTDVAAGRAGVMAMVIMSGEVFPGDVVLVWSPN